MKTTSASLARSDRPLVLLLVAAMVLTLLGCLESAHSHQPGTATVAAAYRLATTTLARAGEQSPTLTLPAERAFSVAALLVCQFLAVLSVALLRVLPLRLVPLSVAPSRASPHVPTPRDDILFGRVSLHALLGCFRE